MDSSSKVVDLAVQVLSYCSTSLRMMTYLQDCSQKSFPLLHVTFSKLQSACVEDTLANTGSCASWVLCILLPSLVGRRLRIVVFWLNESLAAISLIIYMVHLCCELRVVPHRSPLPPAAAAAAACPSICQIKLRTYLFVASWTWRPDRNLIDTPLQLAEGSFGLQISFPFYMLLPCFSPCCRWLPRGTLLTNVFQNHQILGTPSCESGSAACKCSRSRSSRRHRISRCNSPY